MNQGTEGERGNLEFIYERIDGAFAVLRDPDDREVYISRVRLPPNISGKPAPGAPGRAGRGRLDGYAGGGGGGMTDSPGARPEAPSEAAP